MDANAPDYSQPNRLLEMSLNERPQERLERLGPAALSDTELIALLLRSGTRGHDVVSVAAGLIAEAGSLAGMIAWKESDFERRKGIGRVKAVQLIAVMEIARRVLSQQAGATPQLNRADLIADYFRPVVQGLQVEKFWVVCLNRKNRLIKRIEVTSGTATASLAHPREVFREAVREAAAAVVCVHNHPSGDPAPSAADIQVTRQLREAARALDIQLLDHVIVGQPGTDPNGTGYYSFRSAGLL
jgi:DNA repair protein RadC